jgi:DNA invertase Pin-like site-specific DNA recombinase
MVKPTLPVDIYVRVSRVGGRENLISPDEQERRGREHLQGLDVPVGKVLVDLDESGGKWDRPGLQDGLQRVEAGVSGGLCVGWLDRLTRDSEHAHTLLRRINDAGGTVYAPDAPADMTTPEGELQVGFAFAVAQYQRQKARAGFARSQEQAIARGIPVHTRAPIGYRARADRRMEPDPKTAGYVRELFERRARGDGPVALGEWLERCGVRTSQGSSTWSKPAIYGVLRNRSYLGEVRYAKFVNVAAHEPIVDLALWQAAQHPNGTRKLAAAHSDYLLAGIVRCAGCGYCLQGTLTSRRKPIYRCTRRRAGGVCQQPARVPAPLIEDAAVVAFWAHTADLEAQGAVVDAPDELRKRTLALERAERLLTQYNSPDVQDEVGDMAVYAAGLKLRAANRDRAADELGRARVDERPALLEMSTATLAEAWERMSTPERRELLALRFDCLALRRDRSVIVYPVGTAPVGLPRRGFRRDPQLVPFADVPDGARVLAL